MRSWTITYEPDWRPTPYVLIEGKASAEIIDQLRQWALSQPDTTWEYAQFGPPKDEFARFHVWIADYPTELVVRRSGGYSLLAPANSVLVRWLEGLGGQVHRIQSRRAFSALVASALVTRFSAEERVYLDIMAVDSSYTDEDRTALAGVHWNRCFLYLMAAHLPDDWRPLPPGSQDTRTYKEVFDALARIAPAPVSEIGVAPRLHHFIQLKSHWPEAVRGEGAISPSAPEAPRFTVRSAWSKILETANHSFLCTEEIDAIHAKVARELVTPEVEAELESRRLESERTLHQWIQQAVSSRKLAALRSQLGAIHIDPAVSLHLHVGARLRAFSWSLLQTDPCEFCGEKMDQVTLGHELARALRGEKLPFCSQCLYRIVYPPEGEFRRPSTLHWVQTRQEVIDLVRHLARETGVVPSPDLTQYLAKVPKEKLLPAIRLLRQLPAADRRKELVPEGWLAILSGADLLTLEKQRGIGLVCTAEDGHPCRSMAEKYVDDWLHAHGIAHECEPLYPSDMELNPNRMRADFRVGPWWIEYFGLMSKPAYREKAELKRRLAARYGLKLIELYPEHLTEQGLMAKLAVLASTPGA